MGVPSVLPSNTPDQISGMSVSSRWVVSLLWPGRRRARSGNKSSTDSSSPAGQPSMMQRYPGPWLTPAVVTRNSLPNVFPAMKRIISGGRFAPRRCPVSGQSVQDYHQVAVEVRRCGSYLLSHWSFSRFRCPDPAAARRISTRHPGRGFGIPAKPKSYPQDTAKKALASASRSHQQGATRAISSPICSIAGFVESRISDRANQFAPTIEFELVKSSEFQQIRNPDGIAPKTAFQLILCGFSALVIERSRERAFRQLVRDVEDKMLNDPVALKQMKQILRGGTIAEEPNGGARATHPDVKDRAVFLKKLGDRWFLENRQEEAPMKAPRKRSNNSSCRADYNAPS